MKIVNDSLSIDRGFSRITEHGRWTSGEVATHHGFVTVYAQENYSRLDFVHGGRLHMRRIDVCYTPRGLARAAHRFASEIANNKSTSA